MPNHSTTENLMPAQMSPDQRMMAAAKRTVPLLGSETGAKLQDMLEGLVTPMSIALIGAWGLAQLTPAGWIADGIMLGIGAISLGKDAAQGFSELAAFVSGARSAKTEADLDVAAQHLAKGVTTLGIDTLQAILLRKAAKEANVKTVPKKTAELKRLSASKELDGCIPCKIAAAKKAAAERLAKHNIDIEAHRSKYERLKQQATEKDEFGYVKAYKGRITEAKGEQAATAYMLKEHPDYELASGFGVDTGFDQIWVKRGKTGNIEEITIVEAKGPKQSLKKGAKKGDQMTQEWVENTANEWDKSPTADQPTKDIANLILKGMKDGYPKVGGKVIRALENEGSEELPCPNRGNYRSPK